MCAYELRSNNGSDSGSVGSWSSVESGSSRRSYKYRGKKYGNKNKTKLVRCCAKTLSGKRCSRNCDPVVGNVCYQHTIEYKLEQVQKSMALKDRKMVEMQLDIAALIIRVKELEVNKVTKTVVEPVVEPVKTKKKCNMINIIDILTYFIMAIVCMYYYEELKFEYQGQCAIRDNNTFDNGFMIENGMVGEMVW